MNLKGLRVLNTRPSGQGKQLSEAIERAGGVALECPALAIVPTPPESWLETLSSLARIEQAIFTSPNAVDCFFIPLMQEQQQWPNSIEVIAIGQATATALEGYNIRVNSIPEKADSEHLLDLPVLEGIRHKTILLVKGKGGRTLIPKTLIDRGANLLVADVYERIMPQLDTLELRELWHNQAVDLILFTSYQAMRNIFSLFGESAHSWLCSIPCIVISERLAKEAKLLGMERIIVGDLANLLNSIEEFNTNSLGRTK